MNPLLWLAPNFPIFHTKLPFHYLQRSPNICAPLILIKPELTSPEVFVYWELHTINRTETTDCATRWAAHSYISYQSATHRSCMQRSCPLFLHSGKAKQPQDSSIHCWKRCSEKPEQHSSHRICQRFVDKSTHQQPPRTINNLCIFCLKAFWWMKAG